MPRMDPAIKGRFIQYMDQVKEDYRRADGELDVPAAVNAALVRWAKEYPVERAWWDSLSPQHSGEVIAGEYKRRRRSSLRNAAEANVSDEDAEGEESHDSQETDASDPTLEELYAEYNIPVGGGGYTQKALGRCTPAELDTLEDLLDRMELGNHKTKIYIRKLRRRAVNRQLNLRLDDSATLFEIFGV